MYGLSKFYAAGGLLTTENLCEYEIEIFRQHGSHDFDIDQTLCRLEHSAYCPINKEIVDGLTVHRVEIIPLIANSARPNFVQNIIRRNIRLESNIERNRLDMQIDPHNYVPRNRRENSDVMVRYTNIKLEYYLED